MPVGVEAKAFLLSNLFHASNIYNRTPMFNFSTFKSTHHLLEGECILSASPCGSELSGYQGKLTATKTDEFSEKLQTVFDPPPSFSENHVADFWGHVNIVLMPSGTENQSFS